ncbi:hypothetical protein [Acetobacter thailandicus]|uniref:Chromosome partitioning protein ParB n=1 Tax=Acetobacter thailandicus TaxID=1502842 RepID=A0ABT3QC84_9PROT|nr:hypothetical protein [Acetobacter thailandicus]MCX2562897.1 hypothetical protein [Acetobacter thailandicus]
MPRKPVVRALSQGEAPAAPARRRRVRSTETPLDIFLRIMRGDDTVTDRQFEAAKVAAPYVHPKLTGMSVSAVMCKGAEEYSDEELTHLIQSCAAGSSR